MDGVRDDFGGFYDKLFSQTVAGKPHAVVTEYSWAAGSCDPCPVPALSESEIMSLGGDVLGTSSPYEYTLTRLHYRYTADHLGQDLVFKAAPPIVGGRGMPDAAGLLAEQVAAPSGTNNFQGRYVILHPWDGKIACKDPVRGQWGGPSGGAQPSTQAASSPLSTGAALRVASPKTLAQLVDQDIPEIGLLRGAAVPDAAVPDAAVPTREQKHDDEPRCSAFSARASGWLALGLGLVGLLRRRR